MCHPRTFHCWHVLQLLVTHARSWYAGAVWGGLREVRTSLQLMTDAAATGTC